MAFLLETPDDKSNYRHNNSDQYRRHNDLTWGKHQERTK